MMSFPPLKKGMCFGTFDLLHPGHIYYIEEAMKLVDELVIVIARDHRVQKGKGRLPIHTEEERKKQVEVRFPKATVILGDMHDMMEPVRLFTPNVLIFGYDQHAPFEQIQALFPDISLKTIDSYEPHQYKSSIIRASIN